mgnify:CR=1 FL=1
MPRLLWLLCLVNLIIGTGAFVIGGILAPILTHITWSLSMLFLLPLLF